MKKILASPVNGGHEFYLIPYKGTYLLIHVHGHNISYDKCPGFFAYEGNRDILLKAIKQYNEGLKIIVCFMYASALELDYCLFHDDNFKPDQRREVMVHIENYRLQILTNSRKVLRIAEAEQLIRVFRYSDAKTHCELYDLDFDSILGPIHKNMCIG
jgi:hypothetical protein